MAKGYSQVPGMDYTDTYSPVVRLETIRTILALAVSQDWEIQQMDVKGAYLNGILKEDVFMEQPEGYEDGTSRLCRLIKTLYGLKQSGREWNIVLNEQLETKNLNRLYSDPCVYIRKTSEGIEIITVWVDDLLLFTSNEILMSNLKRELQNMFEVTDLGDPSKIVGIEIERNREKRELKISQTQYIESILKKNGLVDSNAVGSPLDPKIKLEPIAQVSEMKDRSNNYASLIGSLMYAAVATRPDIAYAVYRLASYTANPDIIHWTAVKHVLRYLIGTKSLGIIYKANNVSDDNNFVGYSDASFANNDDRTSVSGYTFLSSGGAIGDLRSKMLFLYRRQKLNIFVFLTQPEKLDGFVIYIWNWDLSNMKPPKFTVITQAHWQLLKILSTTRERSTSILKVISSETK